MASVGGIAAGSNLALTCSSSSKNCSPLSTHRSNFQSFARISTQFSFLGIKRSKIDGFRGLKSVQTDVFITSDDEAEMGEGFFAAIEELERMAREPSDVLEEMNEKLSARELQLVLVYFAQEGRDSWCALEVFEWLKKENRVDKETMELMVSIMCAWAKKLIEGKNKVEEVVNLLVDMDCVGLKAGFSMVEKVISLYWEAEEKNQAILFVEEVLRRGIIVQDGDRDGNKGGPVGYLAWKMMEDGNFSDAAKLVINLRESGLKPEPYSYLIAMTAIVKELNEFAKALRRLKAFSARPGPIIELDPDSLPLIETYQETLLTNGLLLSNWAINDGGPPLLGPAHERLLAMYVCAGRGPEAEQQLWEMKLAEREVGRDLHDIVLAICASQDESGPVGRLLARLELAGPYGRRKTLTWLLRGYIKGGHFGKAAETVIGMLDSGLCPEYVDRVAVVRGLSGRVGGERGDADAYVALCKRLSDAGLVSPIMVYLNVRRLGLWVVQML
ncbi:pentatricopeptide (PPR) repeat-containing protein [Striga asiatica]|uniref:Pentatricopeptide (PPR) repeat-containing protein n=1 Tax=Striga asiatica TaxID=4170 RepID=A0A5A7NYP6_STRAF|nr:pentatricopeptide (PPR) repeat-containing protein [Striga asiatica]